MKKIILPIFVLFLTISSVLAQVNITFELNTATIANSIDPSGLYIAGGTGFGSPGDNQLLDPDGDGIYTITLQREVGFSSYYIFTNGNCPDYNCKENIAGLPCSDPANFNDRFLPAVTSDITVKACFNTCDSDGTCTIVTDSVDITFNLNTESLAMVDPSGVFIAGGGNFGNPGDNPMVDPDGDGIYTITIRKPMGFSSHYTFTNGNCPDYLCKEDLAGLPCGDPNSFNDRFLPAVLSDTTILACFGLCASDGTCTAVDSIDLTFQLNTESIASMIDPSGIFLAGGAAFGNPGDNPMVDPDGDGIYTITLRKPMGFFSHYTFTNGNCPDYLCKEDLTGLPCGDPNSFNDRFLSSDMTMTDVTVLACFGNCANDGSCTPSSVNGLEIDQSLFSLQPSVVQNFTSIIFGEKAISQDKQILVVDAVGQIVHTADVGNETTYRLNTTDYANGLYFLSVVVEKRLLTRKFVVQQ